MPTWYDWELKRSGAAIRLYGTALIGSELHHRHKLGNIGKVAVVNGIVTAYDRTTHAPVAHLSLHSNPRF